VKNLTLIPRVLGLDLETQVLVNITGRENKKKRILIHTRTALRTG